MTDPENAPIPKPAWWRRLFGFLFRPSARLSVLVLLLLGIGLGSAAVIGTQVAVHVTSTNEFCVGCHEMNTPLVEYQDTIHYKNRSGVRTGCADCHNPHGYPEKLWVKAISGAKDIYGHYVGIIDTPEKFEARRLHMATSEQARMRKNDSAECRHCHDFKAMNPDKQKPFARKEHERAITQRLSCIECHKGIAHTEP